MVRGQSRAVNSCCVWRRGQHVQDRHGKRSMRTVIQGGKNTRLKSNKSMQKYVQADCDQLQSTMALA